MHQPTAPAAKGIIFTLTALALLLMVLTSACSTEDGNGDGHDHDHNSGPADDPLLDYCNCMLQRCHDAYHATWGEDHLDSETACVEAAGAVPLAGEEVTSGNYLECRQSFCSAAEVSDDGDDPDNCPQAMGEHTCI